MCSCLRGFVGDGCVHCTDLWRNMFQGIQLIKSMDQIVRMIIDYRYITHAIYVFKQLHSWVVVFSLRTIHLWFVDMEPRGYCTLENVRAQLVDRDNRNTDGPVDVRPRVYAWVPGRAHQLDMADVYPNSSA